MSVPAAFTRARVSAARGAAAAALLSLASSGSGCSSTHPCAEGTLFLTLTFEGDALSAERVVLQVMTEGEGWRTGAPFAHASGSREGTIEIRFPDGYPTGKDVTVAVTAQSGTTDVASNSGTVKLGAGCGNLTVPLGGGSPGTGGGSPTGSGGSGTGGGTGVGGRGVGGTAGGGTGGRGSGGTTGSGGRGTGGTTGAGGVTGLGGAPGLCTGTPFPGAPLITDFSETAADGVTLPGKGGVYAYGGVSAVVTNGGTTAGNRLLHVTGSVAPGTYAGVGLYFTNCADVTGYLGYTGRLAGTLGTCDTLSAGLQIPQNLDRASGDPHAQCTGTACYGPKGPLFLGANGFVSFASMTSGRPVVTVGPEGQSRIVGIEISFHAPSAGCTVDFTLDDLSLSRVRPGAALETFDGGLDGFGLNFYNDGTPSNLALPREAGGGVATLVWDTTLGDPAPGSLRVTAPFSDYNQYVDAVRLYDPNTLLDWTGKRTLWVRVRLDGGTGFNPPDQPGGAQVHVNSFIRGLGGLPDQDNYFSNYDPVWSGSATWVDYPLDLAGLAGKPGWDPAHISSFGVQLNTGAGRAGAVKPTPASFHIDSFWLE